MKMYFLLRKVNSRDVCLSAQIRTSPASVHLVLASDPPLPVCTSPDSGGDVLNYTASSKLHWKSCRDLKKSGLLFLS